MRKAPIVLIGIALIITLLAIIFIPAYSYYYNNNNNGYSQNKALDVYYPQQKNYSSTTIKTNYQPTNYQNKNNDKLIYINDNPYYENIIYDNKYYPHYQYEDRVYSDYYVRSYGHGVQLVRYRIDYDDYYYHKHYRDSGSYYHKHYHDDYDRKRYRDYDRNRKSRKKDRDKDYKDEDRNDDYKSIHYPHDSPLGQKHLDYHKKHNTKHHREDHN